MRIGVVGGGTVGRATARAFMEHAEVRVYDVLPERRTHRLDEVMESDVDLIFVCLPTPQKPDSLECDLSAVEKFFADIHDGPDYHWRHRLNLVLRSTVPIGTTRRLRDRYGLASLVHSPEFLTARCAVTDAQLPARNIIGGTEEDMTVGFPSSEASAKLWDLYESRFPGVPIFRMTSDESEAVKLFTNGFFAVKLAYWNEVRCLADKLGLDWGRVLAGVLADGRIAHSHTSVPGPDGKRGFGGACLPKDLASLIDCMERTDVDRVVCAAALTYRNDA